VKAVLVALALTGLVASIPAMAHHSFAAHYFEEQTVRIEGEVVKFEYKSPHAWVYILVKDESGQLQQFSAEWANPNRLQQQGVTTDTLKSGDYVIITGSPGRNPADRKVHLKRIERPSDGWRSGMGRGR
jgi:hypothetical protein